MLRIKDARQREDADQLGGELLPLYVELKYMQTGITSAIVGELIPAVRDLSGWFDDE